MPKAEFPSDDHARLNILAGAWDTNITALNPDGAAGGTSKGTDIYSWMPNGQFLVHDVDAMMGDQRVQSTEIFGVDAATGAFPSRSYDPDGSTNDFVSQINGRGFSIDGKSQRFSGEFSQDGQRLQGEWRHLVDGRWLPFVRIELNKRR